MEQLEDPQVMLPLLTVVIPIILAIAIIFFVWLTYRTGTNEYEPNDWD